LGFEPPTDFFFFFLTRREEKRQRAPPRSRPFFLGLSLTSLEGEEKDWGALSLVFIAPQEMNRLYCDQRPPHF
jgi:hypothetical protein